MIRVGIQTITLGGSFHEAAARQLLKNQKFQLFCYSTHSELVDALTTSKVDEIVIALFSLNSGPVPSAIEALAQLGSYSVIDTAEIPIKLGLLAFGDTKESDVQLILSQKPALDQCSNYIKNHNISTKEHEDTLGSALEIAQKKGRVNGKIAASIASDLAAETAGLNVLKYIGNDPDSTTRFQRIKIDKR